MDDKPIILFDCDGVICPPMRFAKVLKDDFDITPEMTREFFTEKFAPAGKGQITVEEILPHYLNQWGWKSSIDDFLNLWVISERDPDPERIRLVQELRTKGYRCCLATNQESNRANFMRNEMKFTEIFDELFISSEIGFMKPEPEFYVSVSERLEADASKIYFIDDQQHYLDAAAKHGWNTHLFSNVTQCRAYVSHEICPLALTQAIARRSPYFHFKF
jgi:putative hydrolase of the HAD superfamily